tara:strand:+ start:403 stop:582 length:180 start_codon:yes stop_codon:yes gene_type:complete
MIKGEMHRRMRPYGLRVVFGGFRGLATSCIGLETGQHTKGKTPARWVIWSSIKVHLVDA